LKKNLQNSIGKKDKLLAVIRIVLEILIPLVGIFFILDVPLMLFRVSLFNQQYIGLFWALTTTLLFLTIPARKGAPKNNPQWYDLILAVITLSIGCYIFFYFPAIVIRLGIIYPIQIILGILVTIVVIESVRRTSGASVVGVVVLFLIYAKWGYLLPGKLGTSMVPWSRLFQQLLLGADFMLGTALKIASGTVFGFIFFGVVFLKVGASDFIMDLTYALMGRVRGGPAKVAIVSSNLFGSISGSAVANVAVTGMITIPLMKKTGYPAYYAGAVEAVASTGGQIMPPIMGAAAFVMAEFLGVPYARVVVVAIVPALLYYLCLFIQVDNEALKNNLKGLPKEQLPRITETLKKGWVYTIPVLVLIYALFVAYQNAGVSALYAILTAVIISLFNKTTRAYWKSLSNVLDLFQSVSRSMFEIIAICAAAGFVIGVISYTGLGLSFSQILTMAAGGRIIVLALLTAVASVILGMGMPTTASYIMLAVLAAPAMIRLDVIPIVAHFFVFYFGTLSMITPPVCLSVFAASSISKAPTTQIAWQAIKLGFAGYIVPFIFLFNPSLALVTGTILDKLVVIIFTVIAIIVIASSFSGYFMDIKLNILERLFGSLFTIILVYPNPGLVNFKLFGLKGIVIIVLFLFYLSKRKRKTSVV